MAENIESPDSAYVQYRREAESDRMARSLRAGCVVVALLSTGFIPLDYAVFRDRFLPMLAFRLFCNSILVLIILRTARTNPLASAVIGCLTTGAMLLTVISSAGGVTSEYAPGLMLLFLGMPVLLPFTARQAGTIVFVLAASLAALPFLSGSEIQIRSYVTHLIFPLAAGIEAVAASALMDRMRFADFLRRREIELARDDLKALDKEKSRFTANIHHELRTPLTLMIAPVDALLAGDFGEIGDLPRSYLESVQSNGQRLLKLINNLLDLAKLESNKIQIRKRPTDVWKITSDYVASARPLAEYKGVYLSVNPEGSNCTVNADPEAVEKIVANLLSNALKFTDSGGRVSVLVRPSTGNSVELTVSDTGIGLPEDQLEMVFDRFAQVDTSNSRKHEGTGIGLALVRELVSLHDGTVWAESEGLGFGVRLNVRLPEGVADDEAEDQVFVTDATGSIARVDPYRAYDEDLRRSSFNERSLSLVEILRDVRRSTADEEGQFSEVPLADGADAPMVLIVEDNHDMRRLLSFILGKEFRVVAAKNGTEGFEKATKLQPDLVVTDVMMPEMSGTDLCQALKGQASTQMIPVVLVTSKAERDMKIRGLEIGADDYVTKPFHPAELMARIRSLVRIRRLQLELTLKNSSLEIANSELTTALGELREAGSALIHAERLAAIGELAAGVAHEVNNPVNFATNALRTLKEYTTDISSIAKQVAELDNSDSITVLARVSEIGSQMRRVHFSDIANSLTELIDIVTEGLDRTQRMVAELRDFAKPGERNSCRISAYEGVRSTIRLIHHSAQTSGVSLHVDVPENLPTVNGDPRALNQVLLNLIKNACEATKNFGGNVWINGISEEADIVIRVRDDGHGVANSDRERLFEPFFSTKAAGMGTGLGLSISRRVVEEMGGTLSFQSGEDFGAEFVIRIPAASNEEGTSNET